MTPICLTGGAGWLGQNVLHALSSKGADCHLGKTLVRTQAEADSLLSRVPAEKIVIGDIREKEVDQSFLKSAPRESVLIHTAGIIHPLRIKDFYEVNVQGTANLLEAAHQAGIKRVVVLSSNSPCGCNPHPDHLFDEESPYHPYMNYGRSKMKMEETVNAFSSRIETVLIRAPWFYGPFQPARQTLFFRMIRDGKAPIVGDGTNLRSMAYTQELAGALLLAATSARAAGQTYWIADERPYAMNEIVDTVERLLEEEFGQKCKHTRLRLPWVASEIAYFADWLLQSGGLYHPKIHVLSEMNKTIACSIRKAEEQLGFRPRVTLEEGMRRSLHWCLENGHSFDFDGK